MLYSYISFISCWIDSLIMYAILLISDIHVSDIQGEIDSITIIVRDFNTPITSISKSSIQKNQ